MSGEQKEPFTGAQQKGGSSMRGVPLLSHEKEGHPYRPEEVARVDQHRLYPTTALLTQIVPRCAMRCIFCSGPPPGDMAPPPTTLSDYQKSIDGLPQDTFALLLTGGEPTELEWLVEGIAYARDAGVQTIQMQSHLGRAGDSGVASSLVDAGLTAVDIPLYGSHDGVHDRITGVPGSLKQTLAGMDRMRARGARVVIHNTLFQETLSDFPAWFRRVTDLQPDAVYIQRTADVGPPGTFERVAPGLKETGEMLEAVLSVTDPDFDLVVADSPVCLAPSVRPYLYSGRNPDPAPGYVVMPYSDWLGVFTGGDSRAKLPQCDSCSEIEGCAGVQREALAYLDRDAIAPVDA